MQQIKDLLHKYSKVKSTIKLLEDDLDNMETKIKEFYLSRETATLVITVLPSLLAEISTSSKKSTKVSHPDLLLELGREKYDKYVKTTQGKPYMTIKFVAEGSDKFKELTIDSEVDNKLSELLDKKNENVLKL